jgi:hypothetical protein
MPKSSLLGKRNFRTLANSRAKLFFQDETILVLSDNTTIDIANFQMTPQGQRQSALMKILHGSMRFIVTKVIPGAEPNFEIQGTTATLGVRGTDGIFETRSPDVIYFLSGRTTLTILNNTTGQRLTLTPNNFISAIPGQPMRTGIITPGMRKRLMRSFQVAQSSPPPTVTQPPPLSAGLQAKLQGQEGQPPVGQEQPELGNPLISQDNPFINTLNPGAQGASSLVAPLPVVHPQARPK